MNNYFESNYFNINLFENVNNKIRKAQLGAIMSIGSHFSVYNNPALISMPTGTGKTAVIMLAPYLLKSKKVLIITPSVLVRSQIADDYKKLKTLKEIGLLPELVHEPQIFEMKSKFKETFKDNIEGSDVIVATPKCALSLSNNKIKDEIDFVIIDEAHHEPARTWKTVLKNMQLSKQLLFTATPFRRDDKYINAEIIFNYPLSKAYEDKIYSNIKYVPVKENNEDNDVNLAKATQQIYKEDETQGKDHLIMARTDSKKNALSLKKIYEENTDLSLEIVDSSKTKSHVNLIINQMRDKEINGVICVDMMAEGFDFPNLKIAAIHSPHKSLAPTLQFIGRFTRINGENLGDAKFVAINNEQLLIENIKLYQSDAIWQDIITNLSDSKVNEEIGLQSYINNFETQRDFKNDFSLHSINIYYHAKVFRTPTFDIDADIVFPGFQVNHSFTNTKEMTKIFILKKLEHPKWVKSESNLFNVSLECIIVYYDSETNLLFINSTIKNEKLYTLLSKGFCGDNIAKKLRINEVHRVLSGYNSFEFFNTGLSNNKGDGESYKISSGPDVSTTFDESTGQLYSAGHVFLKVKDHHLNETIGYSSSSKIWASNYGNIKNLIEWFDKNAKKLIQKEKVITNTAYDKIPMPESIDKYPDDIFMCEFHSNTYEQNHNLVSYSRKNITDISVDIFKVTIQYIELAIEFDNINFNIIKELNGEYKPVDCSKNLSIQMGNEEYTLDEYLNEYPLTFYTSDLRKIYDDQISLNIEQVIPFNHSDIIAIDWEQYNTDITKEFYNKKDKANTKQIKSIHDALKKYLLEDDKCDYVFYDHGSGEMADYITIEKINDSIKVHLVHVKRASTKKSKNSNVGDIYEVAGQCIKSINWLKSKEKFLSKVKERREKGYCKVLKGDFSKLDDYIMEKVPLKGIIVACQPSLTDKKEIPDKIGEILSSVEIKMKNNVVTESFEVWGSKG